MPSISDIVLGNIESISDSYALNITAPGHKLQELSESVHKLPGYVLSFERVEPVTDRSLVAVDGGNALEQLSGGDLMVAGATIGEGWHSKPLYASVDDYPSEAFFEFMPHTSNNDKLQKSIRAALELRVLEAVPADFKIIDGAYVGNVSAVLYALIDSDVAVSNGLLELNFFDSDGLLQKAIASILRPSRKNLGNVVAVVKSDSSMVYTKKFIQELGFDELKVTDRILASRLLKPGEFLVPRNINSNPGLIAGLKKTLSSPTFGEGSSDKRKLKSMLEGTAEALESLSTMETQEGVLWTTYFKPTAWSKYANAVKIEFPFYKSFAGEQVEDFARRMVQMVDQDILEENVLEPWCQYAADKGAKDVSHAMNMVKGHLLSSAEVDEVLRGLFRGYRT